ncbi:MAG: MFS transporter [Methylobacterium sp.]|nr:MFS transporter [Methylobacterium sp.]MBX9931687.1 MFS transporter [Methylobacterium sp.]
MSFAIGTTSFREHEASSEVADSLGAGFPKGKLLVSSYAPGVGVDTPIVAIANARLRQEVELLAPMAVLAVGNPVCTLAPDDPLMMLARVVIAFAHGAFLGLGGVVARSLGPHHQRTRSGALTFAGLTLANVLGVPFGTAPGQAHGWRVAFLAVLGIGLAAAARA